MMWQKCLASSTSFDINAQWRFSPRNLMSRQKYCQTRLSFFWVHHFSDKNIAIYVDILLKWDKDVCNLESQDACLSVSTCAKQNRDMVSMQQKELINASYTVLIKICG